MLEAMHTEKVIAATSHRFDNLIKFLEMAQSTHRFKLRGGGKWLRYLWLCKRVVRRLIKAKAS